VGTAVLDPVEGLTGSSAGEDYLGVMRANIDAVRSGQACA
jgi:zinc transport system substrate-binding protein